MAQVGRDRPQQVELALGEDEVAPRRRRAPDARPARPGARTRRDGRRGPGRRPAARRRRAMRAVIRLTSPASRICSIESRNFAATSLGSSTPVKALHARPRSAKRGVGHVHHQRRPVDSAAASRREAHEQDEPLGALVDRAQQRASLGRAPGRPARRCRAAPARQRPRQAERRPGCRRFSSSRAPSTTTGAPAAAATTAPASGPHTTSGSCVSRRQQRGDLRRSSPRAPPPPRDRSAAGASRPPRPGRRLRAGRRRAGRPP